MYEEEKKKDVEGPYMGGIIMIGGESQSDKEVVEEISS